MSSEISSSVWKVLFSKCVIWKKKLQQYWC